jgi:hypothetical protein
VPLYVTTPYSLVKVCSAVVLTRMFLGRSRVHHRFELRQDSLDRPKGGVLTRLLGTLRIVGYESGYDGGSGNKWTNLARLSSRVPMYLFCLQARTTFPCCTTFQNKFSFAQYYHFQRAEVDLKA